MEKGRVTLSVHWSTSVSQTNGILQHECHRISIIHCILVTTMCHQWKSVARLSQNFHYSSILVTRMSYQWKSAAQMSQNFHHTLFISDFNVTPSKICCTNVAVYSLFRDGEGWGYTVCTLVNICQSNQWNSAARMLQNLHHTLYIIDYNVSPMVICCMIVTEFSLLLYSLFGDGEGWGYTVCTLVDICQSNQ
jgi:hypothetical protein